MRYLFFIFMVVCQMLTAQEAPVVFVIGTRPEAIKVIPAYQALKKAGIPSLICSTGQHKELVNDLYTLFEVTPDIELNIMKPGQSPAYVTEAVLRELQGYFQSVKPSLVVVQGDTCSAFAAALSAYYSKIPVGHIEAGLRTHDMYAPFPEEIHRQLISRIASLHFAPTDFAAKKLKNEGIPADAIFVTGNTVVDALYAIEDKLAAGQISPSNEIKLAVDKFKTEGKTIFLLTAHRRESFEGGLKRIMSTVRDYLFSHPNVAVLFPVHPNPAIAAVLQEVFVEDSDNLKFLNPVPYHDLVYLLSEVDGVLTDSGGIQEEAVSLQRPTLVLRNETDRPEAIQRGLAVLVGTDPAKIVSGMDKILASRDVKQKEAKNSPYGDGQASQKIAAIIGGFLDKKSTLPAKKRILVGSPIRQTPEILDEFLLSLENVEKNSFEFDYYFVDDNIDNKSSERLRSFTKGKEGHCFIASPRNAKDGAYNSNNEVTHVWSNDAIWKVGAFKDTIIEHAKNGGYDYLFLIDSDLVLHPKTIEQLIADNKEIVFNVFWTKWTPNSVEQPQVWVQDEYSFFEKNGREAPSQEEQLRAPLMFISRLKIPGVYPVGGGGACTLISRKALLKGLSFKRIRNLSFWGEDRHFCIRAGALGVQMYVDTHYPAYHIYRPSALKGVEAFKECFKKI
jgi:UDP-N-acetylglucosamine 2-epimerase (non-hydrolysing)